MGTNGTIDTVDDVASVRLTRLARIVFEVPIRGTAPLIVNRWTEKARQMMLDNQQTKARAKKDPKDPAANFEASRYRLPDGSDGFPATAFKAAIVDGARYFDGLTMTDMKRMIVVVGEGPDQLVPLEYGAVTMREDTPRNSSGGPDLRYRAQFWPWSVTLKLLTVAGQFDNESLFALVDAGGIGGVGDWRPSSPKSKTGTFGTFEVVG